MSAPTQARAPSGTKIGGRWIDTPGAILDAAKAHGIGVRESGLTLGVVTPAELKKARAAAKVKAAKLPTPTDADRAEAEARHLRSKRQGGDDRPGSKRRKVLREQLLTEFGDGQTCPCLDCGKRLDVTTVSMDRIIPGSDNGRYVTANLIPLDYDCNRARSNTPFEVTSAEWATILTDTAPSLPVGTTVRARPSGWDALDPDTDEADDLAFTGEGPDDAPTLDGAPEWVTGVLGGFTTPAGYFKHLVGDVDVDGSTVEATDDQPTEPSEIDDLAAVDPTRFGAVLRRRG